MFVRNRYRDIKQKYLSIYFYGLSMIYVVVLGLCWWCDQFSVSYGNSWISASDPHTSLLIVIKSSEQWHI